MIIYEVNLSINKSIFDDFLLWLKPHIDDILKIDGFKDAYVFQPLALQTELEEETSHQLCVQYRVESFQHLEHYLQHHADKMREEGQKRFPEQFSATRRILKAFQNTES